MVIIDYYMKSSTGSSVSRGRYSGILLSDLRMEAARLRKSRKTQKAVLDFACCTWHDSIIIYFIRIVNVQFDLCDCAQGRSWQMLGNHIVARVWAAAGSAFTVTWY